MGDPAKHLKSGLVPVMPLIGVMPVTLAMRTSLELQLRVLELPPAA